MDDKNVSGEIYGMPSFAILRVADPAQSKSWYEMVLGFKHIFSMPGPRGIPLLVHLRWTKYADLLLQHQHDSDKTIEKGKGLTLNFAVTSGTVDELAERARQYGAAIVSEPKNQPWNARDFSVADPDGFILTFTKGPVDEWLEMDSIVKRNSGR